MGQNGRDYAREQEEFGVWLAAKFAHRKLKRVGDEWKGLCPRPAHPEKHPSFSYSATMGSWVCSCGKGKASELMEELGWSPGTVAVLTDRTAKALLRAPDDIYVYANGNRKLKWRTPHQKSRILWQHESGRYGVEGEPGLYRLDKIGTDPAVLVHLSESESDADALAKLGFLAIATPNGAGQPIKSVPPELEKRHVVVWEHQDGPGRKYATETCAILPGSAIARPPKPHKDVRDWISAGATKAEVLAAANAASRGFPEAEPAQELLESEIPDLEYALRPLASIGNLTLLQGDPKGGKSCFALLSALAVALGLWPCGRWTSDGRERMTLFLSYEDGRRRIKRRLRQYLLGIAPPLKELVATHLLIYASDSAPRIRLDDAQGVGRLRRIICEYDVKFVVIDTLSHLTAADENKKQEMQPVMDALKDAARELGCAIMVVHHAAKPGKDGGGKNMVYRSRGSSAIAAAADVILDWGKREGNVTSCSLVSKDDDGDAFAVEYQPDGEEIVRWRLVDAIEDDDRYGNRKAIIEALSKIIAAKPEGATRHDVAEETGISRNTVIRHLEALREEGSIQARRMANPRGGSNLTVYAPITHVWPSEGGTQ